MGGDFTWNWRWLSDLVAGPRSQEVGKKWVSPTKYERFIKWNVHKRFQFKIFNVFPNQLASHWFPNCFPQLYLVVQFDSKIFWKYVFFLKTSINFFHVHLIYNFTWLALKSFPKRPWHMIQDYWTKLSSLSLCAAGQVHRYLWSGVSPGQYQTYCILMWRQCECGTLTASVQSIMLLIPSQSQLTVHSMSRSDEITDKGRQIKTTREGVKKR